MTKEKKSHSVTPFYRALWFYVVLFWVLISIVCFFPSWFTSKTILDRDFSNTGEIGDTIGGIMTPFIAIIGAFVTFIAFWVQYEANRSQRKDIQIERFENNFYEMLKIHRDNVAEMKMSPNYLNKKIFPKLFLELKYTFYNVNILSNSYTEKERDTKLDYKFDDLTLFNISYLIYYYGIGENSDIILIPSLRRFASSEFINYLRKQIGELKKSIRIKVNDSVSKLYKETYELHIKITSGTLVDQNEITFYYIPFDGHAHRLGHYYRHLFQLVKFVSEYDETVISIEKKYNYLKTLRAQLTSFEQLLLYYNSISFIGRAWNTPHNDFIAKYQLIKNIQLPLANFGMTPAEKYSKRIEELKAKKLNFFEWDEE